MIVYADASALVKRYVAEAGSPETNRLMARAEVVGTVLLSRAEVAAALAKAVRLSLLPQAEAAAALRAFRSQWSDLARLPVTEVLMARADALAWDASLRGYDAVHLAAALSWQDSLAEPVTLATFDRRLWNAGSDVGLAVWPDAIDRLTRAQV